MAFENVKIVDLYFEKGLAPKADLTLVTSDEVIAVEESLSLRFPNGYEEFVTTFGKGVYYGHNTAIRVEMPLEIETGFKKHQEFLNKYWFWEESEELLSKKKGIESITICDNYDGDVVVFHPSNPSELFVLPHSDDLASKIGEDFIEAIEWLVRKGSFAAGGTTESLSRRLFVPNNPFLPSNHEVISPEGYHEWGISEEGYLD